MHELVIRGGTVVDGTGADAVTADVAVDDGVVTAVGDGRRATARAGDRRRPACSSRPGFVDVHTHYDGQVTWDPLLTPSCWHGVTTVVMGNCGVGLRAGAARPARVAHRADGGRRGHPRRRAVRGHHAGAGRPSPSTSTCSTRPPLRRSTSARRCPHGAVRAYVMGERGATNEPATPDDIAAMAAHRARGHRGRRARRSRRRARSRTAAIDGEPVPGTFAAEDELFGIGRALGELGTGVFELAPAGVMGEDLAAPEREVDWMRRLSARDRPAGHASRCSQHDLGARPVARRARPRARGARREGADLRPQVGGRPLGLLLGLQTFHPFREPADATRRSRRLPLDEQRRRAARPGGPRPRSSPRRRRATTRMARHRHGPRPHRSRWASRPTTSPAPEREHRRASPSATGRDPSRTSSTTCCSSDDGRELLMRPLLGYSHGNLDDDPRDDPAPERARSASATAARTAA